MHVAETPYNCWREYYFIQAQKKYTFAFTKFASFNSGGNSAYSLSTESTGCQLANGIGPGQETLTYLFKSTMISQFFYN